MKNIEEDCRLILETLVVSSFMSNCYILGDEKTKEAVVIDPGDNADTILLTLAKHQLSAKYIILTHAHIDHVGGVKSLKESTNTEVLMHKDDSLYLKSTPMQALFFGVKPSRPGKADGFIDDGKIIKFGDNSIKVIHTPGHSPGGICLYTDNKVFVGDTLFAGSIGRTDLPGGDYNSLITAVKDKLFILGDDTEVYPGHGPMTTIGYEKQTNPFFQ